MRWLLEPLAGAATRRPALLLAALAVVTVVLGALATQQQTATDITEFSAETELSRGFDRIEEEFGARGGSLQVVVDAGAGGTVLDREGLIAAERIHDLVHDTPEMAGVLADGTTAAPAVSTWASSVLAQLDALDLEAPELTEPFADILVDAAMQGRAAERVAQLLSTDFDADTGRARAGLAVIEFDPDATTEDRLAGTRALDDALDETDFGFLSVDPFSFDLLTEDIESGFETELPLLLAISLALMVVILAVLYRRTSDVLVGLLGLIVTIVWMTGLSVLLGPSYLGVAGEFNQIAIAVPVLLVGLGIDYSVHLTTRYRENRRLGQVPAPAAATAVRTVGAALVLATATTMIGFLSNLVAPLPPIRDFGMFAAAGVASAFVVLGGLVPAVRVLLDRRHPDRVPAPVAEGTGTDAATRVLAALARRAPYAVLAAALVVGVAGTVAAGALDSEFSQDEFIPSESDTARLLTTLDERFGGDVAEETLVLVDADYTDADTWAATLEVERALAGVDGVVSAGDRADVRSVIGALDQRTQAAAGVVEQAQREMAAALGEDDDAGGLDVPDRLTLDDLPEPLRDEVDVDDPADADQALADADGAGAGLDFDTEALDPLLPPGTDPTAALADRLFAAQLADGLREAFSGGGDRLAGLDAARARELVDRDPEQVSGADLAAAGYPVADLDAAARELLADADALRDAGWDGTGLAADADVAVLREVLAGAEGGGLDSVLADDAETGLLRVSTRAGEDGAERLADDIAERLAPLTALGADTLVVSEQLLVDETLAELNAAQTQAIVVSLAAALLLLVVYYAVNRRRPLLGLITMLPALLAVPLVLGSMWLAGLSFNALTATIASIAIGIGVPYGIHVTNRFVEQLAHEDPDAAVGTTLANTGAALVGSAITTGAAFVVLMLSDFTPISQFGGITALTIGYALLAAGMVESAALVVWGRREVRRHPAAPGGPDEAAAGRAPAAVGPADEGAHR